jgi:hypothetical protein
LGGRQAAIVLGALDETAADDTGSILGIIIIQSACIQALTAQQLGISGGRRLVSIIARDRSP